MSHAMHRMPPNAARPIRPVFAREPSQHGWAQRSNSLAVAALVLGSALASGGALDNADRLEASARANPDEGFNAAVHLYESGQWDQAFKNLAALADHGHLRAARLALLMLRYGATLYGTTFSVQPGQVARWAQRVLRANSRATASPSSITASA